MKIVIVGQQNGKRRVQWFALIGLASGLAAVCATGQSIVHYFMSGDWSGRSAAHGAFLGLGIVLFGFVKGLLTPVEKLTPLK